MTTEWSAIMVAATALITVGLTKGVDALLRIRGDARTDTVRIEAGINAGLKLLIERQDDRIRHLEESVTARERDHDKCVEAYNTLKEAFLQMKFRLEAMERREKRRLAGEVPGSDSSITISAHKAEEK